MNVPRVQWMGGVGSGGDLDTDTGQVWGSVGPQGAVALGGETESRWAGFLCYGSYLAPHRVPG